MVYVPASHVWWNQRVIFFAGLNWLRAWNLGKLSACRSRQRTDDSSVGPFFFWTKGSRFLINHSIYLRMIYLWKLVVFQLLWFLVIMIYSTYWCLETNKHNWFSPHCSGWFFWTVDGSLDLLNYLKHWIIGSTRDWSMNCPLGSYSMFSDWWTQWLVDTYPLVIYQHSMEHGHVYWIFPLDMTLIRSYVSHHQRVYPIIIPLLTHWQNP